MDRGRGRARIRYCDGPGLGDQARDRWESTIPVSDSGTIELMFDAPTVLGIDPGLSRCGYGAVIRSGTGMRAVACGVIRTAPASPIEDRLLILADELERLIADIHPSAVAVERVYFQTNVRTAMSVGQASGLALVAAARAGIPVATYGPNEVKQSITGYGAADKRQVQEMVKALLGLDRPPSPPDAADALALAMCHLSSGSLREQAAAVQGVPIGSGQIGSGAVVPRLADAIAKAAARDGAQAAETASARAGATARSGGVAS